MRFAIALAFLVACGEATPTAVAPAASSSGAPAPASGLEPGKGLVVSPKCSDVHDAIRVDVDDGTAGTKMVQVTNTSAELLSISGASKRASAGYGALEQGDHVSFQMRPTDNYYVVAARTKDIFEGADFKAGAPTACGKELKALEDETRAKLGITAKP
jgi:hypothetical protein